MTQTYHGLHKIITKSGIEPSRTDNHRALTKLLDIQLTNQLCTTIDTIRTGIIVLHIRYMLCTVKDVVCRNLNHPAPTLSHSMRQICGCLGIQLLT